MSLLCVGGVVTGLSDEERLELRPEAIEELARRGQPKNARAKGPECNTKGPVASSAQAAFYKGTNFILGLHSHDLI